MPYAVVVPGISNVFDRWQDVERIISLYPYPKFRKFATYEECWEYVKRNTYKRFYKDIYKYGETFDNLYVTMEYFIRNDKVCYNYFTKKIGYIAIECDDANIEVVNRMQSIKVTMKETYLNDNLISNHIIAIWHGLRIIGDYIDVDIKVPDHSIFYALMTYKGNNKIINKVRNYIDARTACVSVTLKGFG